MKLINKIERVYIMKTKTVTFGGGCFWCTEAIFKNTKGVITVKNGFSGGFIKNPPYREVCTGRTGHAEVIQLTYDPAIISLEELVTIHLLTHNPTTVNAQGADKGTQYRSIVFYNDDTEKEIIEKVIQIVQENFSEPIVTEVKPFEVFYNAEDNHQNYYEENKDALYCRMVISPKIAKFRKNFTKYNTAS